MNYNQGSDHGRSKLTEDDIRFIRVMRAWGYGQRRIADFFRVHQSQVSRVLNRHAWTHIPA